MREVSGSRRGGCRIVDVSGRGQSSERRQKGGQGVELCMVRRSVRQQKRMYQAVESDCQETGER